MAGNRSLSSFGGSSRFALPPLISRIGAAEARPRPLTFGEEFRLIFKRLATAQLGDDTDEILGCYTIQMSVDLTQGRR